MKSYKDLIVWQKSIKLCEEIYKATERFPKSEMYGLTSQIRRSSVAIPSNIAEGHHRGHRAEFTQFLRISYGSGAELETQLLIAKNIGFLNDNQFLHLNLLLEEIMKMLNKLLNVFTKTKH